MQPKDYAQLLYQILTDKPASSQDEIVNNLKKILIKNKESYIASTIGKEFIKIQEQKQREKTTYITSNTDLSASQKKELESISSEPREFLINPELLGGVAIRQKDKVYNAALKKRLELLRNKI